MKKILMSMKVVENPNYVEVSNIIAYEYVEFFEKLGFTPILVPNNSAQTINYFDLGDFAATVLIGGNNVDPSLYGGEELSDVYPERDRTESLMIQESIKRGIPVIGICRGFQKLNVEFGGRVTHGIDNHVRKDHKLISESSILNGKVTNTYHNQGVVPEDLSNDLNIIATTADGFIEAFIHKKHRILGVQWHPERQDRDLDITLIENFLEGRI